MQDDEEWKVEVSPQVMEEMASDPEVAKAMREFFALVRQVGEGLKSGQYKTFEEGMEILTGHKPMEVDGFGEEE